MNDLRAILAAILLAAGALAAGGCRGLPAYQAIQTVPHKDVVSLVISLEARCSAEVYRKIAMDESARIARDDAPGRPPLYEVKVLFILQDPSMTRLAQVNVIHSAADPVADAGAEIARAGLPRVETTLY